MRKVAVSLAGKLRCSGSFGTRDRSTWTGLSSLAPIRPLTGNGNIINGVRQFALCTQNSALSRVRRSTVDMSGASNTSTGTEITNPAAGRSSTTPYSTQTTSDPVLIIGAGLAGLSLAQALKKANIPFHVYERDQTASFRTQGYRIRINPDGAEALQKLLPDHQWELFRASCADVIPGGHQYDALTAQMIEFPDPARPASTAATPKQASGQPPQGSNQDDKSYNADRAVLRNLLLSDLENFVSFGKSFERFSLLPDGRTEISFADGSTATGRFIVGADGVGSRVRHQLLPRFSLLDTEGRAIFGKTTITPDLLSRIPPVEGLALAGTSTDTPPMKLFADKMEFSTRNDAKPLDLPRDYIYWVLSFRLDRLPPDQRAHFHNLNSAAAAALSAAMTAHWHESFQPIFAEQDLGSTSVLTFLTANPSLLASDEQWSEGRDPATHGNVTVIGDAAHPMPPVGGVGANTAFQDARDLFVAMRNASSSFPPQKERLRAFEETMRARASIAVARSAGGARRFFGMKPVEELAPPTW